MVFVLVGRYLRAVKNPEPFLVKDVQFLSRGLSWMSPGSGVLTRLGQLRCPLISSLEAAHQNYHWH